MISSCVSCMHSHPMGTRTHSWPRQSIVYMYIHWGGGYGVYGVYGHRHQRVCPGAEQCRYSPLAHDSLVAVVMLLVVVAMCIHVTDCQCVQSLNSIVSKCVHVCGVVN